MKYSTQLNEIGLSMSKVQGSIKSAKKDCNNLFFKAKYADLASVWEACRDQLASHGISIIQGSSDNDGKITVVTLLLHSSGQWIESTLSMPMMTPDMPAKKGYNGQMHDAVPSRLMNAQEIGSVITYFRRYSIASMVGVCPEDEDANMVSEGKNNPPVSKIQNMPPQPQKINKEQLTALLKALDPLPKMKASVKEWLANQGIMDFMDMHVSMLDGIMTQAAKAMEKSA
jgi:hypothetical protein